jgi:hypothetical protein
MVFMNFRSKTTRDIGLVCYALLVLFIAWQTTYPLEIKMSDIPIVHAFEMPITNAFFVSRLIGGPLGLIILFLPFLVLYVGVIFCALYSVFRIWREKGALKGGLLLLPLMYALVLFEWIAFTA